MKETKDRERDNTERIKHFEHCEILLKNMTETAAFIF